MSDRLERERPVPATSFRRDLEQRLLTGQGGQGRSRVRLLITAYAGSGLALMAFALLGVAGAGPLASG